MSLIADNEVNLWTEVKIRSLIAPSKRHTHKHRNFSDLLLNQSQQGETDEPN